MSILGIEPGTSPKAGTHALDVDGDYAVIRDVEVFSEVVGNPKLGDVDRSVLARIVEYTNALIERGQYPQVVIRHSDGENTDHASYGRLSNLRVRDGEPSVIVADIRHRREDAKWLHERYPRRSAEIFLVDKKPDGRLWLGNLALLGREPPAADIPDVSLNSAGVEVVCAAQSLPEITFSCMEHGMATQAEVSKYSDDMDLEKLAKYIAKDLAKYMEKPDEKDKSDNSDDGDEDDKKKDKSDNASPSVPAVFSGSPEATALMCRVGELEGQIARMSASKTLDDLKRKGYQFDFDAELEAVSSMVEKDRSAHFARIEKYYRRVQTADSLVDVSNNTRDIAGSIGVPTDGGGRLTPAEASRISSLAAEFSNRDPSMTTALAMAKAAEQLGLSDKVKKVKVTA